MLLTPLSQKAKLRKKKKWDSSLYTVSENTITPIKKSPIYDGISPQTKNFYDQDIP